MSRDLNQCSFIGRLGKDVEIRYMPGGEVCANFSIAVGDQWKDKNTGEKKEKTEWVNISCFGKLAEICGEYLKKGSRIYASGAMETRKYTGNDGAEKYSTGIKLKDMQMLDSANNQGQQGQQAPMQQAPQRQQQAPQQSYQQTPAQQQQQQMAQQQQQAPQQNNGFYQPPANQHPQRPQQHSGGAKPGQQYAEPPMDFDIDIPF